MNETDPGGSNAESSREARERRRWARARQLGQRRWGLASAIWGEIARWQLRLNGFWNGSGAAWRVRRWIRLAMREFGRKRLLQLTKYTNHCERIRETEIFQREIGRFAVGFWWSIVIVLYGELLKARKQDLKKPRRMRERSKFFVVWFDFLPTSFPWSDSGKNQPDVWEIFFGNKESKFGNVAFIRGRRNRP